MESDLQLSRLLYLYNNITVFLDSKNKRVLSFYDGNQLKAHDISYDECVKIFREKFNFSEKSEIKLKRFFTNLSISQEPFSADVNYELENGNTLPLIFKGYKDEDGTEIIIVSKPDINSTYSSIDYLTKVLSREAMTQKINLALTKDTPFALLLIDIDNFKEFNDSYGHMYGDIVLVETASSIKKFIGNNGFIGRIGGDEFLVLMYVDNKYNALHEACSNIKKAINNVSNHNIKKASITATVGCAAYPNDGTTYDILFKKIDVALYRGKRKGRNCFIIYDKDKCGEVSSELTEVNRKIDSGDARYANYNIISGVAEIINRDENIRKNINDSLSLLGSYFLLDRITLYTLDIYNDTVSNVICWCNPRINGLEELVKNYPRNVDSWRMVLDNLGMFKIVQVESNKDLPIYQELSDQNVKSTLAFELKYMDKIVGFIRFDMCTIDRFWQQNDISTLMVTSKLFAIMLNRQNEKIQHHKELYYDKLTSIYNYIRWRDLVDFEITNNFSTYSLMYFNIEGYKHLNDIYGSKICDEALINVGLGFRSFNDVRTIFCRVTDDKFLVYLPTQDKNIIEKLYNHLKENLTKIQYGDKFHLICGVYIHDGNDILTTAIDKANIARKQPSVLKDGICYFSQEQFEEKKFKMELELHMFDAKNNDEFLLYLQPKFNIKTGKMVGAEALTRWNFKGEKILTPNLFIPLFEQNGFIKELDFAVFENVCKFQRYVIDSGKTPVVISVNLSRYQTDFDYYIKTINEIRENYNIDPSLIELEITEGMYISKSQEISKLIKTLHSFGYKVSMDDFGSGYSNLAALADLDFDMIKLDKGFCSNQDNEKEKIILGFVMELAHELDMDVLCEGVETKEFMEYLKDIGCNIVQGFLFDRPIPAANFYDKYIK